MQSENNLKLGNLTRKMIRGAKWVGDDEFPAFQEWADEIEILLTHVKAHGQFKRFLPRLQGKVSQRDGALSEARASLYLDRIGFEITKWEPEVIPSHPGDILIQLWHDSSIFVEVKGPVWKGELSEEEKHGSRVKMPKYTRGARSINPVNKVKDAIIKAMPKFSAGHANLLVIVDNLFRSPESMPRNILIPSMKSILKNKPVGEILLISPMFFQHQIKYQVCFIRNEKVSGKMVLPTATSELLGREEYISLVK